LSSTLLNNLHEQVDKRKTLALHFQLPLHTGIHKQEVVENGSLMVYNEWLKSEPMKAFCDAVLNSVVMNRVHFNKGNKNDFFKAIYRLQGPFKRSVT
jgi:hypothetical protein